MKTTVKNNKWLRISEEDIKKLLAATNMPRNELASLLNINPASLSRWTNPRTPQAPTSTTYLVLIPLLLAAGVDILPTPDQAMVQKHLATFKGLGLLKEDESKNDKVKKSLHRAIAVLNSEEIEASRRLFHALQEAWKKVDESLLHKR